MIKMIAPAATPQARCNQNRMVRSLTIASHLRPLAEKIVVHASQLHDGWVRGDVARQLLDGYIEIEQQRTAAVVANHALDPEERRNTRAARYRGDAVQARRGV